MERTPKAKSLIRCKARCIFVEGGSFTSKTYTISDKLILEWTLSPYTEHMVVGTSQGQIEKNILGDPDTEGDFLNRYKGIIEYFPHGNGKKTTAHCVVKCWDEKKQDIVKKFIYIVGADNIGAVNRIRGMNRLGIGYVDELDKINYQFACELNMRCNQQFIGSMNPNDPSREIYKMVNKSRPLPEFADDVPKEILAELAKEEPEDNWIYYHFNYNDNPIVTPEIIKNKKAPYVEGSALFNSLILGLRNKPEGIILSAFNKENILSEEEIRKQFNFKYFSGGVDTSFSHKTDDTIAISFIGITDDGKCVILEEKTINNRDLAEQKRIYSSDLCPILDQFYTDCEIKWGKISAFYIDCADCNTIGEWLKYKRNHGSDYNGVACNKSNYNVEARNKIVNAWLKNKFLFVNSSCKSTINEFYVYAYDDDGKIIDKNNHNYDSFCYSWTARFKQLIGDNYE